jgi:diguanylate cyclase (GGDEF)-like protein/PAS domain S-box-containing protein
MPGRFQIETGRVSFIDTIVDVMPCMIAYWDKNLHCRFANKPYLDWFEWPQTTVIGATIVALMGEKQFAMTEANVREVLTGKSQHFERVRTRTDGSTSHMWVTYTPDFDARGDICGFVVLATDVTALKAAEVDLKLADSVYHNVDEGIVVTDGVGTILSVNESFTEITGYTAKEVIGQNPRILKSDRHDQAFYAAMWRDIMANGRWQGEIWNRRKNGEIFLEWLTITMIRGAAHEPVRFIAVFSDGATIQHHSKHLAQLAFHDALTGLPNRYLLMERLDRLIARTEREHRPLAVMFLDLDRFKSINDSYGHNVGDGLLRTVADKLKALVRFSDTVARLGGDEFVILLDNPANRDEVAHVAARIIATINEPMTFCGTTVQVGASLGIATHPIHGLTPTALIENADKAMYAAKRAGKNTYRFFDPAMVATAA